MHRWRQSELIEITFFFYLSALTLVLPGRPHADVRVLWVAISVALSIALLAIGQERWHAVGFSIARDWWTLTVVLVAYRSLDLFAPVQYLTGLEKTWLQWDVVLLERWHIRSLIETCGPLLSMYLETCYLLTSAAGCFAVALLYAAGKRERANCFLTVYVLGTLLSYAVIPFLPTRPPRVVFPGVGSPEIVTSIRIYNLVVLSRAGIHTGVWPSAHVSSTFAAAWGMFLCFSERKRFGWIFLVYATSVAIATVYGRYHFAVDAVAGFLVSLVAWGIARLVFRCAGQYNQVGTAN